MQLYHKRIPSVVDAILVPRKLAWTRPFQWATIVARLSLSSLALKRQDIPVWMQCMLLSMGHHQMFLPVLVFLPIDRVLARRLADASGDVLLLPLTLLLHFVGILISAALCITTTLFPKWLLWIKIRMNPVTATLLAMTAFLSMILCFMDRWMGIPDNGQHYTLPGMHMDPSQHCAMMWSGLIYTSLNLSLNKRALGRVPGAFVVLVTLTEMYYCRRIAPARLLIQWYEWRRMPKGSRFT